MKKIGPSIRDCRRWARMGRTGRCHVLRRADTRLAWFPPARQKRWQPGAEEV